MEGAVLDHPQQLRLQLGRQLADLIQEQHTLSCALGVAEMARLGTREGSLLVAEQFALQEIGRDRGAIYGHEGSGRLRPQVMQEPCADLLADSGFTRQQQVRTTRAARRRKRSASPIAADTPSTGSPSGSAGPSMCSSLVRKSPMTKGFVR